MSKSERTILGETKSRVGDEAWIAINLIGEYFGDDVSRWLVEIVVWGDNSDTTISTRIEVDLLASTEKEAREEYQAMLKDLVIPKMLSQ